MVERMTSVEIEDVLSSIRRLVTDDLRPKPVADSKLILTPALRVVPEAPAESPPSEETLDVDLDADLAAALSEEAGAPAPDPVAEAAEDDEPQAYPMFLHHDRRVDLVATEPPAEVAETVLTIGAAIPADGYEAELGDAMPVPEWPESSWVAPDVIDGVEEAEVVALPDGDSVSHDAGWAEEVDTSSLGTVEPETNLEPATAPDDWTDATTANDDRADDLAEAAALAALAAEDQPVQDYGQLTELDEDMLREIVREIIREELQGSLGEKITRNVRKLVRAEINRAMLTDDLE
jgi:hypothetical protein